MSTGSGWHWRFSLETDPEFGIWIPIPNFSTYCVLLDDLDVHINWKIGILTFRTAEDISLFRLKIGV